MYRALLQRVLVVRTGAAAALATSLGLCAVPSQVHAAEPVRLEWVRLEGAEDCIDATTLEHRVRQRLASEPFDDRAARTIEGTIHRSRGTWQARLAVRANPSDHRPALRELQSDAESCESLSNAVVLAVALAVDPSAAFSEPAPEQPRPEPPVARKAVVPSQPSISRSDEGLRGRVALSLVVQAGLLPRPSPGLGLGATAVLSRRLELAVTARGFPAFEVSGEPAYAIGLAAIGAQLCVRLLEQTVADLRLCGGPTVAAMHATLLEGDRSQPGERTWLGAELGLDSGVTLSRRVALLLGARAVLPVTRYRFTVEGSSSALFHQPVLAAIGQVGLQLRFDAP